VKLCKSFSDATLVEMESPEKKNRFLSYLGHLSNQNKAIQIIWLNGQKNANKTWEWNSSHIPIPVTLWDGNQFPADTIDGVGMNIADKFSKLVGILKSAKGYVICEMFVNL